MLSIRYTGSRFARDLENIASRVYAGWVENVPFVANRLLYSRIVTPEIHSL